MPKLYVGGETRTCVTQLQATVIHLRDYLFILFIYLFFYLAS